MESQWDSLKNQYNIKKHGISFEEASELFELPDNLS
ncbi:MAG: BrnT family toxin [Spirochaetia bacterium]|nr:BrnT family toxin [Spirochaetia bacterium]